MRGLAFAGDLHGYPLAGEGKGLILTLGVGCCMLAALVFLPAVLRLLSKTAAALKSEDDDMPSLRRAA